MSSNPKINVQRATSDQRDEILRCSVDCPRFEPIVRGIKSQNDECLICVVQDPERAAAALVVTEGNRVIDGQKEGKIHGLCPLAEKGVAVAKQLEAIESFGKQRQWKTVKQHVAWGDLDLQRTIKASGGWEFNSIQVSKQLDKETEQRFADIRDSPVQIRFANSDDVGFVQNLLAKAIIVGLRDFERYASTEDDARRAAEHLLCQCLDGEPLILIAEDETGPVGHSTTDLAARCELTGEKIATHYDTFILPQSQKLGIATYLGLCTEVVAFRAGIKRLNGSVVAPSEQKCQKIAESIQSLGWQPNSTVYIRQLAAFEG